MVTTVAILAACPYCAGAVERGREGYLLATAIMLLVPLAMLALGWIWLWRAQQRRR